MTKVSESQIIEPYQQQHPLLSLINKIVNSFSFFMMSCSPLTPLTGFSVHLPPPFGCSQEKYHWTFSFWKQSSFANDLNGQVGMPGL